MRSLKTFRVEFDRVGATYMAGEVVTGNIVVETCKNKSIRGLYLSATGKSHVEWRETVVKSNSRTRGGTYEETYSNSEKYFNFEFNLLGARKSDIQVDIPPGHHRYPFTFHLPSNIPSSFEHTYGYVRYTVKSVMDRPWRFDHECKAALTVLTVLDLNAHQQKCLGIDDEVSKNFCCFFCIDQGSLNVRTRIPCSGYVPGQTINTTVDYVNSSNSVEMTNIETRFEQKMKFHATTKTKIETCVVVSSKNSGPFVSKGQTDSLLVIPPLPPSYLEFCNIIDIEYILRIIVHVSGVHWAVNKDYPVLIGTVPLYFPPSAPPVDKLKDKPMLQGAMGESAIVHVPMPLQPNAPYPPQDQPSGSNAPDTIRTIGFVHPDQPSTSTGDWRIPPPSYEECMSGAEHIKDNDESNYVYGANDRFAPRYPVFKYPSPSIHNN